MEYFSADTVGADDDLNASMYPPEFLNMQDPAGFPPHALLLKVGMPVMAIRNLLPAQGIANGTRMVIEKLLPCTIKVRLLTGARKGDSLMIPRTTFISKDNELPFKLHRRQYPIKPTWAMTTNKAQVRSTTTKLLASVSCLFTK